MSRLQSLGNISQEYHEKQLRHVWFFSKLKVTDFRPVHCGMCVR